MPSGKASAGFVAWPLALPLLIAVVGFWVLAGFVGAVGRRDRVLYAEPREVPFAVSNPSRHVEPSFLVQGFGCRECHRTANANRHDFLLLSTWQWRSAKQSYGTENRLFSDVCDSSKFANIFKKSYALVYVISLNGNNRTRSGFERFARQIVSITQLARLITSESGIDRDNSQSGELQIEARFSKIFKQAALESFILLATVICIAFGLLEIEFEVPRQSSPFRSTVGGFGGLFLIFVGQACLFVFVFDLVG